MTTFQFEDRHGTFAKQHGMDATAYADDGHKYHYGKVTEEDGREHFAYALHASGCRCVLEQLAAEAEAARLGSLADQEIEAYESWQEHHDPR